MLNKSMVLRRSLSSLGALLSLPLAAQTADTPAADTGITVTADRPALSDELVLPPDHIVTVTIDGEALRMLVTAEANGPARVNPEVAARHAWQPTFEINWDFGRDEPLRSPGLPRVVGFGGTEKTIPVIWSVNRASDVADGTIGIHHLPFKRITFPLAEPSGPQSVQRFALKRIGSERMVTLGTSLDADGKAFEAYFVLELAGNLITAPTANFIATRFDGGFIPGSDDEVAVDFSVRRRVRMMQLARPIMLGDLALDRFWVRYDDHGRADRVGDIAPGDPRFNRNEIVVSKRKPRGRADFLTRIGRNQIAHCSSLTYDLEQGEIRLTCGPADG